MSQSATELAEAMRKQAEAVKKMMEAMRPNEVTSSIRQGALTWGNQVGSLRPRPRRPDELPFTWAGYKRNLWDALPSASVGLASWVVTKNRRYSMLIAYSAHTIHVAIRHAHRECGY